MGDASEGSENNAEDEQDSSRDYLDLESPDHDDFDPDALPEASAAARISVTREFRKTSKTASPSGRLSTSYITLLNSDIEYANGFAAKNSADYLSPSQIGGSYWTSDEKSAFYSQLSSSGPGDLQKLSRAIGTKSEPEVRAYILLLQAGVREAALTLTYKESFSFADVPAACEISAECEEAAGTAAGNLSKRLEDVDAKREQDEFGEWWLIDQDVAEVVEECFADFEPSGADSGSSREASNPADDNGATQAESHFDGRSHDFELPDLPFPAAQVLIPTAFLQLSSNLFMNSGNDPEANWHHLVNQDDPQAGPAIYQTAFGDFHNLAVSLTRRLVQASIFQAMTRLRASNDARSLPHVIGTDVKAALAVLGMPTNRIRYWATAPRRCGVDVYSDAKQFRDGRKETKLGMKLTFGEVEAKLGLERPASAIVTDADVDSDDTDLRDLQNDSDAFTDTEGSDGDFDRVQAKGDPDEDGQLIQRGRTSKRKRALSPRSYDRLDDRNQEAKDRFANQSEENHLRKILGLDLLPVDERPPASELPYKRLKAEHRPAEWRDRTEYEAPWERHGDVSLEEVKNMEMEVVRGRKRRGVIQQILRARLDRSSRHEDAESASIDGDERAAERGTPSEHSNIDDTDDESSEHE